MRTTKAILGELEAGDIFITNYFIYIKLEDSDGDGISVVQCVNRQFGDRCLPDNIIVQKINEPLSLRDVIIKDFNTRIE